MRRYDNRVALITAAASGLGRGAAFRLATEGARVMIWDRDGDAVASAMGWRSRAKRSTCCSRQR
jgi:NAD(P)-dependent dehydrogenase (short-subunit alcohol dehydrogenase family)